MRKRVQRQCGFTMIELMVGIGIVALLISILMPTLARGLRTPRSGRDAARSAIFRQIQLACTSYENNWNCSCPWSNWHGPEVGGVSSAGLALSVSAGRRATPHRYAERRPGRKRLSGNISTASTSIIAPKIQETSIGGPVHQLTSYLMNGAAWQLRNRMLPSYKVTNFRG